jgi:adenylate cyclase, class 2
MTAHLNFELKARTENTASLREWLLANGADFKGTDAQTDTYFALPTGRGRLKLREGNIENNLIHYQRADDPEARLSQVALAPVADAVALRTVLERALGVLKIVRKTREIYFIENVKFHLDWLEGLGHFVEIEAIDQTGNTPLKRLEEQCKFYMVQLKIRPGDILSDSYSDMV